MSSPIYMDQRDCSPCVHIINFILLYRISLDIHGNLKRNSPALLKYWLGVPLLSWPTSTQALFLQAGCLVLTQNEIHLHYICLSSLLGCIDFINQACIFPQTEDLMGLWEFWEETDLEAEPTWPSWLGNDSKLWSFFTASCGDKHKWLSSYCFIWSNPSFANVDKIICSVEQSGLRVMRGYCSLNTLWSEMIE